MPTIEGNGHNTRAGRCNCTAGSWLVSCDRRRLKMGDGKAFTFEVNLKAGIRLVKIKTNITTLPCSIIITCSQTTKMQVTAHPSVVMEGVR